jgi:hypothetical protein
LVEVDVTVGEFVFEVGGMTLIALLTPFELPLKDNNDLNHSFTAIIVLEVC